MEVVQEILTRVSLAAAGGLVLACFVLRYGAAVLRLAERALRGFAALPFAAKVVLPAFLGVAILYGGSKTNAPPAQLLRSLPRMVPVRWRFADDTVTQRVRFDNWHRRGAVNDWRRVKFADGWVFPSGTNRLASAMVMSRGEIRPRLQNTNAVARLSERLTMRPGEAEFFAERTASNTYLFSWENCRDATNALKSAAVELFRNGDIRVTEQDGVRFLPRQIPFPHDGFGQDADWVRANFTNAEEILSVGYPNWVDAQVGVGLENGLYKLTATFPADPLEATLLTVGDYRVCVTNAGEYVFLLEKGVGYDFDTMPFEPMVTYHADDDLPRRRMLGNAEDSVGGDWSEWTVDWRPLWLELPRADRIGHLCWLPYFTVIPHICHQGLGDPPQTFCAFFGDYLYGRKARYCWTCEDTNIVFTAAESNETSVLLWEMPNWRETTITAHAFFGTNEFTSVARFHYGMDSKPSVRLDFSKRVAFFESNYTNSYGNLVTGRADCVTLNCEIHGGEKGGTVRIDLNTHGKIAFVEEVQFPQEDEIVPGEEKIYSFVCRPLCGSENLDDISASAHFTENETSEVYNDDASITAVEVKTYVPCAWISNVERRELGVAEKAIVYTIPSETELPLVVDGCVYTNEQWLFLAGNRAETRQVVLECFGERFGIDFETLEPQFVSALACYASSTVESGVVGGLRCDFDLRLYPTNVSFSGVEISELAQVATNAVGFFARPELSYLLDHGEHGGGKWHGLQSKNLFYDIASIGGIGGDIGDGGAFTYPIPRAWRTYQSLTTNTLPHRATYDQRFELDSNGTVRIKKFGYVSQRTRSGEVTSQKESE